MPVRLVRPAPPGAPAGTAEPAPRWTCALVNNMPDSAFESTERQYMGLLEAASGAATIEATRHTMAGVPRGDAVAARIAAGYLPLAHIREQPPDALIVTGSNPVREHIADEPYWGDMVDLLEWARAHVGTMLLSCLAAHAALVVFDGLERRALATKRTGVFPQDARPGHPLVRGLVPPLVLPHSRLNTVEEAGLVAVGYDVALRSDAVGWSVATKVHDRCRVVLVQGHPEYDRSSLLREYHRDLGRYVRHEREDLPCLPEDCVGPPDREELAELHRRVTGGERRAVLVESFDFDQAGARAPWPWHATAIALYQNWLEDVPVRSG